MPRKPHFVLAARRWGWPLSPSLRPRPRPDDKRHGMEAEGRNRQLRVRFTTARPRSARDAQTFAQSCFLFLWQRTGRMCYSVLRERTDDESRIDR